MLDRLLAIVNKQIGLQFHDVIARISTALLDAGGTAGDSRTAARSCEAGNLLLRNEAEFQQRYLHALDGVIRSEMEKLPAARKLPADGEVRVVDWAAGPAMSLIPYEEMDDRVAFGSLSQSFDLQYADRLSILELRLAFQLERDAVRPSQNPFRPGVFLFALQEAWSAFEVDPASRDLLLPYFKPDMLFDFAPVYDALGAVLVRKRPAPKNEAGAAPKTEQYEETLKAVARAQAELTEKLRGFFASAEAEGLEIDPVTGRPVVPGEVRERYDPSAASERTGYGPEGGARHWSGQPGADNFHHNSVQPSDAGTIGAMHALLRQPLMTYLSQLQNAGAALGEGALGDPSSLLYPAEDQAQGALEAGASAGGGNAEAGMASASGQAPAPGQAYPAARARPVAPPPVYLPRIKESAPKGSLTRADEHTIDLLTVVFETVYRDENITPQVRDLMGFLQIPVLKAALADKEFFFEESHPARRMIDLLSRMGWEDRKDPEDPVFQVMQRSVDMVGRDPSEQMAAFSEAVSELEASIEAEEQSSEEAMAAPIASALKQEKMVQASRAAKDAVSSRIASGEVIALIEAFLRQKWVSVLELAYGVEDDRPGAVKNATAAMDELIWSVKPKLTQEERKQFLRKLPPLLSALNRWLDVIKWQDEDRARFFTELADCHASIVRAPLELTPARQLEIALEAAQKAAERRLELQAAAEPEPEEVEDGATELVASLRRGMWLEFTDQEGAISKVKLAWISPLRSLFIFATNARQEAFSLSAEQLAQQVREEQARVVRADGLVERALAQAMAGTEPAAPAAPPQFGLDISLELPMDLPRV
jgi:hypothetical protein